MIIPVNASVEGDILSPYHTKAFFSSLTIKKFDER
jgi:hypothetical protein